VFAPKASTAVDATGPGEICLLENLRFHKQEEKNDPEFCQSLATLADFYVNDAFGTAHRAHASTAGVAAHVDGAVSGFLLETELKFLMGAVEVPNRPFAAIVGGAKVSTKLPVLDSLLGKCDKIIIGGAMMFTFFKARGLSVGASLVEDDQLEIATQLVEQAEKRGVKLVFPVDAIVAKESWKDDPAAYSEGVQVTDDESIPDGWMGLDIGPKSIELLQAEIGECQTVVWNGVSAMPIVSVLFQHRSVGVASQQVLLHVWCLWTHPL
jgi:phosphoglycerate kinase